MPSLDSKAPSRITGLVRRRIERGGDRLWRFQDFHDLPFTAVAKALSRLTRQGFVERLSKGTYYRNRQTTFGKSRPNPAAVQELAAGRAAMFPAGLSAANRLGFSTQTAGRREIATTAGSLPRKLVGNATVVHTRRPQAWASLSDKEAAMLDFLRSRGTSSELSPAETVRRTLAMLSAEDAFDRLVAVAATEPPRVRAIIGAIGTELGKDPRALQRLRRSLNPLSRFDFGLFTGLANARDWHAKERGSR
jgi:hypothetical protein